MHRESSSPVTKVSHPFSSVLQVCLPALPHRPHQCQHSLVCAKFRGGWRSCNRHHTTSAQGPSPILGSRQNQRKWCVKAVLSLPVLVLAGHAGHLLLCCCWWGRLCCMLQVESLVLTRRNSHVSIYLQLWETPAQASSVAKEKEPQGYLSIPA